MCIRQVLTIIVKHKTESVDGNKSRNIEAGRASR